MTMMVEELKQRHPVEIAEELEDLPEEEVLSILHQLPSELASDVLEQLRPRLSARLSPISIGMKPATSWRRWSPMTPWT